MSVWRRHLLPSNVMYNDQGEGAAAQDTALQQPKRNSARESLAATPNGRMAQPTNEAQCSTTDVIRWPLTPLSQCNTFTCLMVGSVLEALRCRRPRVNGVPPDPTTFVSVAFHSVV